MARNVTKVKPSLSDSKDNKSGIKLGQKPHYTLKKSHFLWNPKFLEKEVALILTYVKFR